MQKSKVFVGTAAHMMTDVYASFVVGMIPVLTQKLGLSLFMVSTLTAVNFISANLSQPLFGYLSDRYGIRKFLAMGPLMASVFISLMGVVPSYWTILLCLFLGNLGVAAVHPPTASIASYFGGRGRGFANSIVSFGGSIGFSVGSVFIILIIEKLGINFTPLAAVPGILTAAAILRFSPSVDIPVKRDSLQDFLSRLKKVKRQRIYLFVLVVMVAYFRELMSFTLITYMPLYLTGRGVTLLDFGYIFMAFVIIGGLGGLAAGYYSDRIHRRHIFIQVLLVASIPCIIGMLAVPVNMTVILFLIFGFLSISTLPLCNRLVQDIFPRNSALATSFTIGVASGVSAATLLVIGRVADIIGMESVIRYVTVFPLISALLLFLFPVIKSRTK